MRGILQCWIKQACRVELFKQRQSNQHALHSKFHLHTGEEIYSDDFCNHLQIDVVSLHIIFLVQMITSGLQIIYTQMKWLLSKIWYTMSKELIVHQIKDYLNYQSS
ncbi:probable phosphorylase b kinase regulatory subunit beta [Glossina fuscipes]|uniref:Phosphorylase b kinase regulatory subunit n=1 Tax=Glossina fuscipes TaxID=7396 RepID=A0A9C5ZHR2_9MUSC|nr:probable phosphorylase b kinase regulatory subunit beta [Glossina fuscipes]